MSKVENKSEENIQTGQKHGERQKNAIYRKETKIFGTQ